MIFYVGAIFTTKTFGHAPDVSGRPGDVGVLSLFPAHGQRTAAGGQGNDVFSGPGVVDYGQSSFVPKMSKHAVQMQHWFGTIPRSMFSLFQIMTLESWSMGIVRVTMKTWWTSSLFFIFWILLTSFSLLSYIASIFVAKLLETQDDLK